MNVFSPEDKYLVSQIEGFVTGSKTVSFTYFLDEREQALVENVLNRLKHGEFAFFGGYELAERKILGIFNFELPQNIEKDFPVTALTATYPKQYMLTHRDFLGALMALKIKREMVGDIVIFEGGAVLFFAAHLQQLITDELTKVGRVGIKLEKGIMATAALEPKYEEHFGTLASFRLDAVVALLTLQSRTTSVQYIERELVKVNGVCQTAVSKTISAPCTVTVRGYGKFIIDNTAGTTKKGRLKINYRKLIF